MKLTLLFRKPRHGVFSIERVYDTVIRNLPNDIVAAKFTCKNPSSGILPRLRDALAARKLKADVYHVTGDVHYLTFFLPKKRTVLTFHDFGHVNAARGVRKWMLWFFWVYLPVKKCAAIVTISQATRAELGKLMNGPMSKVHVIHNPASPSIAPRTTTFNSDCPKILQLGTKVNKNLERHIAALENVRCRLSIIGPLTQAQRGLLEAAGIDYLQNENLTDAEIVEAFRSADILLFSSVIEGFGLPILEAQAAGIPVITSNLLSMPEVAGDGAILVDPYDIDAIRTAVSTIIDDPELRDRLVAAGFKNLERFSPESIAQQYAQLYRKTAQGTVD